MSNPKQFEALEEQLDALAKKRQVGKAPSFDLLDQYYELLIDYFTTINDIDAIKQIENQPLKIHPINIEDRLSYIQQRKHHYMGYQQMKTLKQELIKMHAAYRVRFQMKNDTNNTTSETSNLE
ncbi:YpoC family protein [Staphylococcus chromogenes]|uniref:YpoC family protein n=1 Tax=Staphylococcus chromogenes TaxID=46126 RepID=UPI001F2A81A4|nr:hypothetical protein [Staphylococcus chromogenes]MCE5042438.1 hypothetical protein [Staphylococcus chromogenes]MDT0671010.1 hypothetical protein [Staphylococcus chromogenes]MDT0673202.1 hypothetical protein [Staphylococcus chromogenes]